MAITVKIEYVDAPAVIADAVKAEEKRGFLLLYDRGGAVIAKFTLSDVRHWWTGDISKQAEAF